MNSLTSYAAIEQALAPPGPQRSSIASATGKVRVHRGDRLGGVIHEYMVAA